MTECRRCNNVSTLTSPISTLHDSKKFEQEEEVASLHDLPTEKKISNLMPQFQLCHLFELIFGDGVWGENLNDVQYVWQFTKTYTYILRTQHAHTRIRSIINGLAQSNLCVPSPITNGKLIANDCIIIDFFCYSISTTILRGSLHYNTKNLSTIQFIF